MNFENLYSTTAERAREQAEGVLESAKSGARKASDWADAGKKPVQTVADAGLKMSSISHRTTDKLVRQQASIVEGEFDALSTYFEDLAAAGDVRSVARLQLSVLPSFARRTLENGRSSLGIVAEAGADVRAVVGKTFSELRQGKAPVKKAAKKATSAAKKTASKVSKKAKSAAKKVSAAA